MTGDIDIYTAPRFRDELLAAIEDGAAELCIDLAGVEFMDSTGLTVLISAAKRLNASGGRLVLAAPSRPVIKLLAITGLNQVFTIVVAAGAARRRAAAAAAARSQPDAAAERCDGRVSESLAALRRLRAYHRSASPEPGAVRHGRGVRES